MTNEAEDVMPRETPSEKWQAWAAVAAVVLACGGFLYNQSQLSGAESVELANHAAEISSMQTEINNQQTLIYSVQTQLAGINQKLDDMDQPKGGGHE
jgi:hypothetical protein